jgi:Tol biopolymer transport system component
MVTEKGVVKLLDFGLAKLQEPETISGLDATRSALPPPTVEGALIGTAAYMSPEQAEGKRVDGRSDIFSFGSVLYEMLTGQKAFEGANPVATLSAVLYKEPRPVGDLNENLPYDLDKIVGRCLRKDPGQRFQHAEDLKVALLELKEALDAGRWLRAGASQILTGVKVPRPAEARTPRRRTRAWLAALLLAGAAGGTAWWWLASQKHRLITLELRRLTADASLTTDPTITPDGKLVAYASDRAGEGSLDLWLQQAEGTEPVRLTRDPADESEPAFSPDGVNIAFRSEKDRGGVYVIPALGGEPRLVGRFGRNPRYSPDGKWIVYWVGERQSSANLYLVSATGGTPRELKMQPPIYAARYPIWSPDSKHILFLGRTGDYEHDWWVVEEETGKAANTKAFEVFRRQGLPTSNATAPADWVDNTVLFSARTTSQPQRRSAGDGGFFLDNANLWQVAIRRGSWQIQPPATRLTFGTGLESKPFAAGSGTLAFASLTEKINVWSVPEEWRQTDQSRPMTRLTENVAGDTYPAISADGNFLAYASTRSSGSDIWLKNLKTGKETRLTTSPAPETTPFLSANASKLAYSTLEGELRTIQILTLGPDGQPRGSETICESKCGLLSDLSPAGDQIVHYADPPQGIVVVDVPTRKPTTILSHKMFLADPKWSPDRRWIAFHSIPSSTRRQVWVAPFRGASPIPESDWIPVTDGAEMDREPNWSHDGKTVYFISERDGFRCVLGRRVDLAARRAVGPLLDIAHFHTARQTTMSFATATMAKVAVARDKIVFSLNERTGNVWLAKLGRD